MNTKLTAYRSLTRMNIYLLPTFEKVTLSHLVSVVHIPLKVTLPCIICGWSWKDSQLMIPVPFDPTPDSRAHTSKPRVVTDWTHTAEGEWTREKCSPWLNVTCTWTYKRRKSIQGKTLICFFGTFPKKSLSKVGPKWWNEIPLSLKKLPKQAFKKKIFLIFS